MKLSFHGRLLAAVAGCAFASGGLTILLGSDLTSPRDWQASQWLTILTVFGTIAAGHLMVDAWRARHLFATLGFLVLFLSGTGLVVYSSVGRQVETAGVTTLSVEDANARLADLKTERQKAVARRDEADQKAAFEIAGRPDKRGRPTAKPGCGRNCEDWKQYSSDVSGKIESIDREISKIGPAKPVNAQAEAMADIGVLFHIPASKEQIVAALLLLIPFGKCLFFEIGSIVSLGFAFRQGKRPVVISVANDRSVADSQQTSFFAELPDDEPPRGRKPQLPKNVIDFAEHPVIKALTDAGGSVRSHRELAQLLGIDEGAATRRRHEVEDQLEIIRVGKEKRIALRA
jgi:hypothetical protein